MIKLKADFDLTNVRHYHPEINIIASAVEKTSGSIESVNQIVSIDIQSTDRIPDFISQYETVLNSYGLKDEDSLPLILLFQQTYSDINNSLEADLYFKEAYDALIFLQQILAFGESGTKAKTVMPSNPTPAKLSLSILHHTGTATLHNSAITQYMIGLIIKAFKDKSFNNELAGYLENVELTAGNIDKLVKNLNYRKGNTAGFCVVQNCERILSYLNKHTSFNFDGKYASNAQCRFLLIC